VAHAERVQSQADENIVRNILHRELIVQLSIVLSECLKSELCVIGFSLTRLSVCCGLWSAAADRRVMITWL